MNIWKDRLLNIKFVAEQLELINIDLYKINKCKIWIIIKVFDMIDLYEKSIETEDEYKMTWYEYTMALEDSYNLIKYKWMKK